MDSTILNNSLNKTKTSRSDVNSNNNWLSEKKSQITNAIALSLIVLGYSSSKAYADILISIGAFAFSGAITNWLAIYMLFEKIPFIYGSGVVPARFKEFKAGIKHLIMDQFFTTENLLNFFNDEREKTDKKNILNSNISELVDLDKIYQGLVDTIMESKFGSMLTMFGGEEALIPIKEPLINKISVTIEEIMDDLAKNKFNNQKIEFLIKRIESIVDNRLESLTPKMVKIIIQDMIQQHLGWLVVWGGVFGGIIGGVISLLGN